MLTGDATFSKILASAIRKRNVVVVNYSGRVAIVDAINGDAFFGTHPVYSFFQATSLA